MHKRLACVIALFAAFLTVPAWAAGVNDTKIEQWVGREFTIIELPQDEQENGYAIYPAATPDSEIRNGEASRLSYVAHHGKHVVIDAVYPQRVEQEQLHVVNMTEVESGMKLTARAFRGQVNGLAPTADIGKAQSEFVGKTIYAKSRVIIGHPDRQSIVVPFGQFMRVKAVWVGYQTAEPLLLVVDYNGKTATIPFAYSWTNQTVNSWQPSPPWQRTFFTGDPRRIAGNSPGLWELIAQSRVREGMKMEQVRLSWGAPVSTDQTTVDGLRETVWGYGGYRLYFANEVLVSIEKEILSEAPPDAPVFQVIGDAVVNNSNS